MLRSFQHDLRAGDRLVVLARQELLHGAVLRGHERGRDVRGAVLAEELRRDLHKHTQGRTVVSHDGEARFPQVGIKARIQMES